MGVGRMRVALAGSRSFGAAVLGELLALGHDVPIVFAHDDGGTDRLWNAALYQHGIDVISHVTENAVRAHDVDLILGAHTHDFIGRRSRNASRLGALIGHPSLLPRHRGRSSVEWTIRMHDPIAGFTWFWADNGVDTGPIAAQDWCHVDRAWSHQDLWREELFPMGVRMLGPLLKEIESGGMPYVPQDSRFATVEPAIERTLLHRPELPELPPGPSAR